MDVRIEMNNCNIALQMADTQDNKTEQVDKGAKKE
jgi:hypothetical protein